MATNPQELVSEASEIETTETYHRPRVLRMTRLVWAASRTMREEEIDSYAMKLEAEGTFNDGFDPGEVDK
jgi:hypothetical protein